MIGKAVPELKYYSGKTYGDGGKAPRSSNVGIMEASGQLHAPAPRQLYLSNVSGSCL
jgi:hypothetical protein